MAGCLRYWHLKFFWRISCWGGTGFVLLLSRVLEWCSQKAAGCTVCWLLQAQLNPCYSGSSQVNQRGDRDMKRMLLSTCISVFALVSGQLVCARVCAKLLQSCPTLCDPTDCSPPGSSVRRFLQAWILDTLLFAKSLSSLFWKQNSTGTKTLLEMPCLCIPDLIHFIRNLLCQEGTIGATVPSPPRPQGGLLRKAPGYGVAALWRWGERKWLPEQISVTLPPQKDFSSFSLISVQDCGREGGRGCLAKVLHSGSCFQGGTGRRLMKW